MIELLQSEFGIPQAVSVGYGVNQMPKLVMLHQSGSSAEVYLHGAHITSWKDRRGDEMLFLSRESDFVPGCAIRGGIPVVFPQFGDGPLPKHGFARNMDWRLAGTRVGEDDAVSVDLRLADFEETRAIWNHSFGLGLTVTLAADTLAVGMYVANTGDAPFQFQAVLHTYFRTADIHGTKVLGLDGVKYLDALRGGVRETETRPAIGFAGETDRIYLNAPDTVGIRDEACGRSINIRKRGMPDVVVWNPWIEKSIRLPDFGDDEYLRMVCVETGVIASPVSLAPGEMWEAETILRSGS